MNIRLRERCGPLLMAAVVTMFGAQSALAGDWSTEARPIAIEPTYVPDRIMFAIDTSIGACPAGTFFTWIAKGGTEAAKIANIQAVLAVLMNAKATSRQIRLYGNNAGCTIDYIHLL
jgi:hypothetical protein